MHALEAEQYAVIRADVREAAQEGSNIIQASRADIRVYLSVGEGNGRPTNFSIEALQASRTANGRLQISASVTNTSGRALDIAGQLALSEGPAELPNGPWNAELTLKSGLVENAAKATITFPDAGDGESVEVNKSSVPWIALGVGALVLLVAAVWWVSRRRKGANTPSV